jgi:ribosomal protein L40E
MPELFLAAPGILAVLLIIYAVILILLPFFILRIRQETINASRELKRIRDLIEAVIPESNKPKPPAKPAEIVVDGMLVRVCPKCGANNSLQDVKCRSCKAVLIT